MMTPAQVLQKLVEAIERFLASSEKHGDASKALPQAEKSRDALKALLDRNEFIAPHLLEEAKSNASTATHDLNRLMGYQEPIFERYRQDNAVQLLYVVPIDLPTPLKAEIIKSFRTAYPQEQDKHRLEIRLTDYNNNYFELLPSELETKVVLRVHATQEEQKLLGFSM